MPKFALTKPPEPLAATLFFSKCGVIWHKKHRRVLVRGRARHPRDGSSTGCQSPEDLFRPQWLARGHHVGPGHALDPIREGDAIVDTAIEGHPANLHVSAIESNNKLPYGRAVGVDEPR